MSKILDFIGTSASAFKIAISGVLLKNSAGNLLIRNSGDTADAQVTASKVNVSGDVIELNSDAAGSGTDWKITLQRPTSGMVAGYTLTLPVDDGSPNQLLGTDGNGVLSWITTAGTSDKVTKDTTSLAFGSAATITMFTLPAGATISCVRVIVDTTFNGTPSMSVGISGSTSKYLSSTQVDLKGSAEDIYEVYPGKAAPGTAENLQISYTAGGATAGAARVEVEYAIPS